MQPLGRKPIKFPRKTNHTKGPWKRLGWKTWWEVERNEDGHETQKREIQKEIEEGLEEWREIDTFDELTLKETYESLEARKARYPNLLLS